ncbi:MAG TPA: hypothetical protein VFF27_00930 [Bacteroidia bacterium]|jgi:cytochrome bd-type quinol oxidase subunit 2|nr:hypothetical protein [Bacteroidia bacterium]
MGKEILKRLFFTFIISFAISFAFVWVNYEETTGLEARQAVFLSVLINFAINILNLILSLTAFLNINKKIRENIVTSMLSFLLLPYGLFVSLFILFVVSKSENSTIEDFLSVSSPSILFCAVLSFQFYRFRKEVKRDTTII